MAMTEQEMQLAVARAEGSRIVYEWMSRHPEFDRSPENSEKIGEFLKIHQLVLSDENLEKAYAALKAKGVSFTAPIEKEPLPEVPMNPKIFTVSDINNMDRERYKKLYFGPHSAQFRARVNEIIHRAKEEGRYGYGKNKRGVTSVSRTEGGAAPSHPGCRREHNGGRV
jgi:hypothetical protein